MDEDPRLVKASQPSPDKASQLSKTYTPRPKGHLTRTLRLPSHPERPLWPRLKGHFSRVVELPFLQESRHPCPLQRLPSLPERPSGPRPKGHYQTSARLPSQFLHHPGYHPARHPDPVQRITNHVPERLHRAEYSIPLRGLPQDYVKVRSMVSRAHLQPRKRAEPSEER